MPKSHLENEIERQTIAKSDIAVTIRNRREMLAQAVSADDKETHLRILNDHLAVEARLTETLATLTKHQAKLVTK